MWALRPQDSSTCRPQYSSYLSSSLPQEEQRRLPEAHRKAVLFAPMKTWHLSLDFSFFTSRLGSDVVVFGLGATWSTCFGSLRRHWWRLIRVGSAVSAHYQPRKRESWSPSSLLESIHPGCQLRLRAFAFQVSRPKSYFYILNAGAWCRVHSSSWAVFLTLYKHLMHPLLHLHRSHCPHSLSGKVLPYHTHGNIQISLPESLACPK